MHLACWTQPGLAPWILSNLAELLSECQGCVDGLLQVAYGGGRPCAHVQEGMLHMSRRACCMCCSKLAGSKLLAAMWLMYELAFMTCRPPRQGPEVLHSTPLVTYY